MASPFPVVGLSPGGAREPSHRRLPPLSPTIPTQPSGSEVGESSKERESSDDVEYHQLLKDYGEAQVDFSSTRLNAKMLPGELDATRDALHFSMTKVSKAQVNWEIHLEQGQNMMNLLIDLRTRVDTLVLCVQAAINLSFPIRAVDNLFTVEELFRAMSARL